jgi:hypothetical protein
MSSWIQLKFTEDSREEANVLTKGRRGIQGAFRTTVTWNLMLEERLRILRAMSYPVMGNTPWKCLPRGTIKPYPLTEALIGGRPNQQPPNFSPCDHETEYMYQETNCEALHVAKGGSALKGL